MQSGVQRYDEKMGYFSQFHHLLKRNEIELIFALVKGCRGW